jgi:spore coat protein U-like protein
MKKLSLIAVTLLAGLGSVPSQAGNATATFPVTITLTSACTITTPAAISLAYTAGGGAVTGTTSTNVACTKTLPYTLSMNGVAGSGQYALTDASTNLNYTLAFNSTGTGGADSSGTGSGAAVAVTIGANISAGQYGTCSSASCTNGAGDTQTVYVNY